MTTERREASRKTEGGENELQEWSVAARDVVEFVPHAAAWQHVGVVTAYPARLLADQLLGTGMRLVLDFGETLVGKVRLRLESGGESDRPVRLKLLAAELPYEADRDPETFCGGLGRGWLQEELVTVHDFPAELELPHRYSLRYLVVTVVSAPVCRVKLTRAEVIARSAAGEALPPPLPGWDRELALIDAACSRTLRNCMQEVFEDGPKRDRRLWLGDLRLQALADHVTFRRYDRVGRCIRLLAEHRDERGMIPGAVIMKPEPHSSSFVLDYSLIFARLLLEHCLFSGDPELGGEFFDAAARQFDFFRAGLDDELGFHHPGGWIFVDHCRELDRTAPISCTAIWAAEAMAELAELLKRPASEAARWRAEAESWRRALRGSSFDPALGMLRSGYGGQLSWASQIWGILAGVLTPEEGRAALMTLEKREDAVKPNSPYLMHYLLEACRCCGAEELLRDTIRRYWGGMISRGADTFWEVYREGDDFYTPYGSGCGEPDPRNNSACHAWSGTPGYFLRTLPPAEGRGTRR